MIEVGIRGIVAEHSRENERLRWFERGNNEAKKMGEIREIDGEGIGQRRSGRGLSGKI